MSRTKQFVIPMVLSGILVERRIRRSKLADDDFYRSLKKFFNCRLPPLLPGISSHFKNKKRHSENTYIISFHSHLILHAKTFYLSIYAENWIYSNWFNKLIQVKPIFCTWLFKCKQIHRNSMLCIVQFHSENETQTIGYGTIHCSKYLELLIGVSSHA